MEVLHPQVSSSSIDFIQFQFGNLLHSNKIIWTFFIRV